MDRNTASHLKILGASAGAGIASLITQAFLARRFREALGKTRPFGGSARKLVGSMPGVPDDLPVARARPGYGNAYYADRSMFMEKPWFWQDLGISERSRERLARKLEALPEDRVRGAVVYDPSMHRRGVLAHEAGHAAIDHGGGAEAVNQRYLRPWLSPVLGAMAGGASLANGMVNPWGGASTPVRAGASALTGAGLGLLADMPVLWSEMGATARAKKRMASTLPKDQADAESKALDRAYHTYLAGALVRPALLGAAGALLRGVL